jgi:alpha-galactosidase
MRPTDNEMTAARDWAARLQEGRGFSRFCAPGLDVRVDTRTYPDFPAVEWVLHLRHGGDAATPVLERILPLDAILPMDAGDPCAIHYAKGALCCEDDFAPMRRVLRRNGRLRLQAGWGRSSSEVLPFFCVDFGGRGLVVAIGWTGEWAAEFSRDAEGNLHLQAGMDHSHLRLYPGEEIRTPSVAVLCWEGERIRGHNWLRRFILKYHSPPACAPSPAGHGARPAGRAAGGPLCNGNWGGTSAATHLDNIRKIASHDLPFEYYWIDAEWFGKPGHWMENAGNWNPRPDLYPDGLEPIGQALARAGKKLLLWFEPERVAPDTPWAREHPEWLLEPAPQDCVTWAHYGDWMSTEEWTAWESRRNQLNAGDKLLNLGNPQARRFLTDFLSERISAWKIGCLRWDSNIAQLAHWRHHDPPDRQGMTEIRYVEGQYALWDELLARHPGLLIDNCASGGRRMDLESLSRTIPLWRTDYAVGHTDPKVAQCHTWGLLHWIPLNGTGGGYLRHCDPYIMRSTMGAAWVCGLAGHGDAPQPPIPDDYPFAAGRRLLEEYLDLRPYFLGDFYPLTEYTKAEDVWMVYQLDRPEQGDGILVVLKRSRSPFTTGQFPLRGLRPEADYRFEDIDRGSLCATTGADAMQRGLTVALPGKPDSAVIQYRLR